MSLNHPDDDQLDEKIETLISRRVRTETRRARRRDRWTSVGAYALIAFVVFLGYSWQAKLIYESCAQRFEGRQGLREYAKARYQSDDDQAIAVHDLNDAILNIGPGEPTEPGILEALALNDEALATTLAANHVSLGMTLNERLPAYDLADCGARPWLA